MNQKLTIFPTVQQLFDLRALSINLYHFRDRELNVETFPALHYPECYLLSQGYKEFFVNYPELCEPRNYVRMDDTRYAQEEKTFHKKSRSWAPGGTMSRTASCSRLQKLARN